jgi:Ca-activated chloride channel homolog
MLAILIRVTVVALLGLCAPCYSQQVSGPATEPTGPVVKVNLIVVDANDHSVDVFKKDDIRVVENKVEQTVISLERDQRPIDIIIAIDATGSFRDLLPYAITAAKLVIEERRPTDEVGLLRFVSSDKIDMVQEFSTDSQALINSLSLFRPQGGQSAVVDAIYLGVDHLAKHKPEQHRRKALIVFTDGEERNSYYKQDVLLKQLQEKGVQIFPLAITMKLDKTGGLLRASPKDRAERFLKTIAGESGGRAFFSKAPRDLGNATEEAMRSLQRSFLVTFRSADTTDKRGFRRVEVKTAPGVKEKAIAPPGYFLTPATDISKTQQ